jgi:hypothetical protein
LIIVIIDHWVLVLRPGVALTVTLVGVPIAGSIVTCPVPVCIIAIHVPIGKFTVASSGTPTFVAEDELTSINLL